MFRFETCWLLDAGCEEAVKEAWEGSSGDEITRRLSLVYSKLVKWSSTHCSNLGGKIKKVEKALGWAQQKDITGA